MRSIARQSLLGCILLGGMTAQAVAQLPQPRLSSVFPLGGKAGTSVDVEIDGDDLDGASRLLFSHLRITAAAVTKPADAFYPEPRSVGGKFTVTIGPDVPAGVYDVRTVGVFGVSNARRFVVGSRAEAVEAEPNDDAAQPQELAIETVVNGRCDERGYDHYRFTTTAGQRLIIQCVSERIDSRAKAAITLYDPTGREVARSAAAPEGDWIIDYTTGAAGPHVVRVHDFTYGGGVLHGYRLVVSQGPWVDFVDPPVTQAGTSQGVTVFGRNLPGGEATDGVIDGRPVQKTPAAVQAAGASVEAMRRPAGAWADLLYFRPPGAINASPLIVIDGPVTPEQEPNDNPEHAQRLYPPFDLVGRFHPRDDADWVTFEATKGQQLAIEVFSNRLGLSTDPFFVVQQVKTDASGRTTSVDLQEVDDTATWNGDKNSLAYRYRVDHADPAMLFTAPEDGTYRVMVRDLFFSSRGDMRHVYRLSVQPARPSFRLVAFPYQSSLMQPKKDVDLVPCAVTLHRGGATPMFVHVLRPPGFGGEVTLSAADLPAGVTVEPIIVPAWRGHGVLVVKTTGDAPGFAGPIRIEGRFKGADGVEIIRQARAAEVVSDARESRPVNARLVDELYAGVSEDFAAPIAIDTGAGQVHPLARGGKLQLPVKLIQLGGFKGDLNLAAIDQHPSVKIGNIVLNAGQVEQTLNIEADANTPEGTFSFYLHGLATVQHQRNAKAAQQAQHDKERIDKLLAEAQRAAEEATQAKQSAEQAAANPPAPDQAQALQDAANRAVEAQAAALSAMKAAEEAKKRADEEAGRLSKEAAARDAQMAVTSPAITLRIVPP